MLRSITVLALALGALAVAACGSSEKFSKGPQTINVVDGKPDGGIKDLKYKKGDTLDLTVKSDTADEVHIHGYDLHKDVTKGGSVHFSFKLDTDGDFEIELENAKEQLADLKVEP